MLFSLFKKYGTMLTARLDLADVVEIFGEPRAIARAELTLQPVDRCGNPVENALVLAAPFSTLLRCRADAKQLIEHDARIAHHRQRLLWRRPADRVGVDARI